MSILISKLELMFYIRFNKTLFLISFFRVPSDQSARLFVFENFSLRNVGIYLKHGVVISNNPFYPIPFPRMEKNPIYTNTAQKSRWNAHHLCILDTKTEFYLWWVDIAVTHISSPLLLYYNGVTIHLSSTCARATTQTPPLMTCTNNSIFYSGS